SAGFRGSLDTVKLPPNYYHAWVELHIEQGPLLERENIPLGIVTNIAAPASYRYEITGFGGHAGALLMPDRRDALCAAAEVILSVERHTLAANARSGAPRETIQTIAEAEGTYERQVGASRNYAHVKIRISPNKPGTGYEFSNDVSGEVLPENFIQSIDEGIREAMLGGVLAGHEMVDIKVSLFDAAYHEADSNEMSFKIAASMVFKEAARKAKPVLLPAASSGVDSVATVGTVAVHPGAINSVPSRVTLTLDIRDTDVTRREAIMSSLHADIRDIESRRQVTITEHQINADVPAISSPPILHTLEAICNSGSIPYKKMVARAYHDTNFIAPIAPVAMIFIPCRNGVSHRPDEYATPESIALGTRVLALALAQLTNEE
ncbi:MAG: M20/M25/M40 family metallo-hydrolase, partial [Acidobacteriaceae bacterium]